MLNVSVPPYPNPSPLLTCSLHDLFVIPTDLTKLGLISLYRTILPSFPSERVCIKIPSTWEGLNACRVLEKKGIHTLGTILFSMEQVALAAEVGCSYIAPYVNELKVHFVPG